MLPCLTISNIKYVSRVKWSNQRKGVAPSPTPWCSSYWKGSLLIALDYGCQLTYYTYEFINDKNKENAFCIVVVWWEWQKYSRIPVQELSRMTLVYLFILNHWIYGNKVAVRIFNQTEMFCIYNMEEILKRFHKREKFCTYCSEIKWYMKGVKNGKCHFLWQEVQ